MCHHSERAIDWEALAEELGEDEVSFTEGDASEETEIEREKPEEPAVADD